MSFPKNVVGGALSRAAMIALLLALTFIAAMAPASAPAGTGVAVSAPLRAQLTAQSLAACRCQQRAERGGAADASPCWRDFWATARPLELSNLRPSRAATVAAPAAVCIESREGPWCLTLRWQTAYGVLCTESEARALEAAVSRAPPGSSADAERRAVRDIREGAMGPGTGV
jgi:hypothetical protein